MDEDHVTVTINGMEHTVYWEVCLSLAHRPRSHQVQLIGSLPDRAAGTTRRFHAFDAMYLLGVINRDNFIAIVRKV